MLLFFIIPREITDQLPYLISQYLDYRDTSYSLPEVALINAVTDVTFNGLIAHIEDLADVGVDQLGVGMICLTFEY